MKLYNVFLILLIGLGAFAVQAQEKSDSTVVKKTYAIDEVVVTGTRSETDVRHLPMSISTVNRTQLVARSIPSILPILNEQVPGLFTTSIGIMGYGVSTNSAGGMRMRGVGGSPTTGMLVLIDGHPQYMGLMGHPIADAYQAMLADKVEVIRGPASVLYGSNAMGGVINIVTRKQREEGVKTDVKVAYGSYNTLTTEAANRIRKGKFSSVVTASYNRTDGHRKNMEFEQTGGYAKLGYDFTPAWHASADLNLIHFTSANPGEVTAPLVDNDAKITRGMTSVSLENTYEHTSGAINYFYNWGRHTINDGYPVGGQPLAYRFHSNDQMSGVNAYQTATLFTGNRLTLGFDYLHNGGKAWNTFADDTELDFVDKTIDEVAGYVDFRQSLTASLTVDAGLRWDYNTSCGTNWVPQVGMTYQLPQAGQLKAIVSKGFRNPTIRELYMFKVQNPDLLPEEMMNYELSYAQQVLDNTLSYGLNVFYINGDNMIQIVPVDGRPLTINTGKIENWGVEATFSYQLNSAWRLSSNYSRLHMSYPVIAAPRDKLFAGVHYQRGPWSLASGLQYISGLYTAVNPDTQEAFLSWNLRTRYRLNSSISFTARGENLLGQHYEINQGYPMPKATFMGGIEVTL